MMESTPQTLRPPWIWISLALALVVLPYIFVALSAPAGQVFTATLINPDDTSVYLSAMRQGQEGAWRFHFQFSPERITPIVMYVPYLAMGHVAGWLGGSLVGWFHGWRVTAGVLTLLGLWWWVRVVFPERPRTQMTAWLLTVFGSGVGWLVAILTGWELSRIPDLGISEWGVVMPMLGTPHFALTIGILAVMFGCVQRGNGRYWLAAAALAVLLGFFFPYLVPVVAVVVAAYVLVRTAQRRRIDWQEWAYGLLFGISLLPIAYYYGVWTRQDANWLATHVTNNVIPSPTPGAMMLGFGLVGLLALWGGWLWLRRRQDVLVPVWAVAQMLLLYLPVPYAGRFLMGLIVPVSTLAAYGLEAGLLPWLAPRLQSIAWQRLLPTPLATVRRVVLILTIPSTIMVVLFLTQVAAVRTDYPLFLPQADETAVQWLAERTTEADVVFAAYPVGNYLPRYAPARVFLGQSFITVDMAGKLAAQARFWDSATSDSWRADFLTEWGVTYLYVGSYERPFLPADWTPPGERVYAAAGVEIYAIAPP